MQKIEGFVLYDEKTGVSYRRVYMDRASANIAITERYEKADIDTGRIRILPTNIVSYVDLRTDIQVKEKCPECGGLGQIKQNRVVAVPEPVVEEKSKKGKKSKKKEEVKKEEVNKIIVEKVICPKCQGKKEIWKETKAIVIY